MVWLYFQECRRQQDCKNKGSVYTPREDGVEVGRDNLQDLMFLYLYCIQTVI